MKIFKKILKILLASPFIISGLLFDIIKLPIVLFIVAPLSLLMALNDKLDGNDN